MRLWDVVFAGAAGMLAGLMLIKKEEIQDLPVQGSLPHYPVQTDSNSLVPTGCTVYAIEKATEMRDSEQWNGIRSLFVSCSSEGTKTVFDCGSDLHGGIACGRHHEEPISP